MTNKIDICKDSILWDELDNIQQKLAWFWYELINSEKDTDTIVNLILNLEKKVKTKPLLIAISWLIQWVLWIYFWLDYLKIKNKEEMNYHHL